MDLDIVNFDNPTEVRTFAKGRFEVYRVGDEPYVSLHILGSEGYAAS